MTRCFSAVQKGPDQLGELPNRLTQNFTFYFFFAFALFSAVLIFKRSGEKKRAALNSVNEVTSEKTEKIPSVICSALPVSLPGKTTRFYLELTAAT